MKKIIFIFLLVILLSSVLFAETPGVERYVSVFGNNSNSGQTPDSAYLTVTQALLDCSNENRDTIYLMHSPDTYFNENIIINKQRVTLMNYGNLKPVIKRLAITNDAAGNIIVIQTNNAADSLVILNIQFGIDDYQEYYYGINSDVITQNIIIENCDFLGNNSCAIRLNNGNNDTIIVQNNYFSSRYSSLNNLSFYTAFDRFNNNYFKNNIVNSLYRNLGVGVFLTSNITANYYVENNIIQGTEYALYGYKTVGTLNAYLNNNNFYDISISDTITSSGTINWIPTVNYKINSNLLNYQNIGVDTFNFYSGYYSNLTPDTIYNNQVGLSVDGIINNLGLDQNRLEIDTIAFIINSSYNIDTKAAIIANDVFAIDTKAQIIANDVFNNDTRIAIFFSINYNTATANLTMLSSFFTADSLTIASELLDLDTTFIIYPAQSAVYNDTNYFLLSWENLKGAIGSWKVELATDAAFTTDYDSIIIDVNTSETANTTQYYKQLNDKIWYMRVIPYSAKLE